MASMTEADFGSDTDDEDYKPEGETQDVSEEENSGEDENPEDKPRGKNKKKRKTKKTPTGLTGRKNVFDEEEEKVDWKKALEEEKKELDEKKQKKKENDIWEAFKKDTSVKAPPPKPKSSIASLFADTPSSSSNSSQIRNTETKKPYNRLSSLFDDVPSKEETITKTIEKPKSLLSGLFDDDKQENNIKPDKDDKPSETKSDKIEIKKVFDFAGEMVTVSKEVSVDSAEAKKFLKSQEEGGAGESKPAAENVQGTEKKRPSGLAGIVGSIGKK